MEEMKSIIRKIGREPLCNGHAERAPHIGSFCFPLCWRCTSIAAGSLMLYIIDLSYYFWHPMKSFFVALGLMAPCLADGLAQKFLKKESNNLKRVITGLLAGFGTCFIYPIVCLFVWEVFA